MANWSILLIDNNYWNIYTSKLVLVLKDNNSLYCPATATLNVNKLEVDRLNTALLKLDKHRVFSSSPFVHFTCWTLYSVISHGAYRAHGAQSSLPQNYTLSLLVLITPVHWNKANQAIYYRQAFAASILRPLHQVYEKMFIELMERPQYGGR